MAYKYRTIVLDQHMGWRGTAVLLVKSCPWYPRCISKHVVPPSHVDSSHTHMLKRAIDFHLYRVSTHACLPHFHYQPRFLRRIQMTGWVDLYGYTWPCVPWSEMGEMEYIGCKIKKKEMATRPIGYFVEHRCGVMWRGGNLLHSNFLYRAQPVLHPKFIY